jgi:competence ComEA-like helix-hairpin-helix protein
VVLIENGQAQQVRALVVGFGRQRVEDGGLQDEGQALVQAGSLDVNTFQVLVQQPEGNGLWSYRGMFPRRIVPVVIRAINANQLITQVEVVPGPLAKGAAFICDDAVLEPLSGRTLFVVVKGDFVLDERGRAIDAEHVRGQLPTGDRPERSPFGIQGGTFESWLVLPGRRIDINRATLEELRTLPRVGPVMAERILTTRDAMGGFTTVEDLMRVPGIGTDTLNVLSPFVEFRP